MSTIEYRRCDYLGCIASASVDDDELSNWGCVSVESFEDIDSPDHEATDYDLCPEHVEAIRQQLEGGEKS